MTKKTVIECDICGMYTKPKDAFFIDREGDSIKTYPTKGTADKSGTHCCLLCKQALESTSPEAIESTLPEAIEVTRPLVQILGPGKPTVTLMVKGGGQSWPIHTECDIQAFDGDGKAVTYPKEPECDHGNITIIRNNLGDIVAQCRDCPKTWTPNVIELTGFDPFPDKKRYCNTCKTDTNGKYERMHPHGPEDYWRCDTCQSTTYHDPGSV